ncbi:uncharacterized protein LOC134257778 [Saccostrea cucullata]|uniref:uncharacterized protein LOC134257778 n=1 Tax=Saccostrea cuccullata TaxID=36930 RepID=UPI002ED13A01
MVNVNDIQDQCSSHQCLNDGACQTLPNGDPYCHCTDNFWGKYCEKGFCDNHSFCQNNGVCYKNQNEVKCLCPLGYSGTSCSTEANKNFTSHQNNGGHFTETALPETVTCYLDTPCLIPVSVTSNKNHMPNLEQGSIDRTLRLSELSLENIASAAGIVRGKMVVVGEQLGLKRLCLDSFGTPKNGRTEDEICFNVNVITGNHLRTNEFSPHFVSPTFPDKTILQCKIHEQCHLSLWAKNKLLEENCPLLKTDKKIENGIYIFPQASGTLSPCVFDVVITVNNITDLDLCFTLYDNNEENVDIRCYTIQILPNITVKGACVGVSCHNDGFCDGQHSPATCKCRSGFSGESCLKDFGRVQGQNNYTYGAPLFGDVALPKLIKCPLSKDCSIPFTVSNANKFNVTWNGTSLETKKLEYSGTIKSRDFTGEAVVVHKALGIDPFCLSLTSENGDVYDSVCCNILTESGPDSNQLENDQPHFINPSPTNGSEFTCTPGKPCHVTLSLSKGNDIKCPEIRDRSDDDTSVHIFTSPSTTECHNDVWIGSSDKDNGKKKEYCFQTMVSGVPGSTTNLSYTGSTTNPSNTGTTSSPSANPFSAGTTTNSSNAGTTTNPSNAGTTTNPSNTGTTSSPSANPFSAGTTTNLSYAGTPSNPSNAGTRPSNSILNPSNAGTTTNPSNAGTPSNPSNAGTTTNPSNAGTPSNPSNAGTTTNPSNAGTTTNPSNARTTTNPFNAGTPSNPSNAGTPSNPSNAGTPSNPSNAGTSSNPSNPSTSSNPFNAGTTSNQSNAGTTTNPSNAGTSSNPSNAGSPTNPSNAGTPSNPSNPGTSSSPSNAGTTTNPSNAGTPSNPSNAGTTSKLSGAGTTTNPSNAGTTSSPSNAGTTSNPSNAGTTTNPSNAGTTSNPSNAGTTTNPSNAGTSSNLSIAGTTSKLSSASTTTNPSKAGTPSNPSNAGTPSNPSANPSNAGTTTVEISNSLATAGRTKAQGPITNSHCKVMKAKEKAKHGRVECFCQHPSGKVTKVITLNPRASKEKLLLAAGLGSGAMISTLGLTALLYVLTKRCSSTHKPKPNERRLNQAKRKIPANSWRNKKE